MRRVLVLLVAMVSLAGCASRVVDEGPPSTTDQTVGSSTSPGGPGGSPAAGIYAAGMRALVAISPGPVYLYNFTCPDVMHQPGGPKCGGTPIDDGVLSDLTEQLQGWGELHVVGPNDAIPGAGTGEIHGAIVTLGPFHWNVTTATVQVSYQCGGLCGQGAQLTLARSGSGWKVTGQDAGWIS